MLSRKPQKGDRVAWPDGDGGYHHHATVLRIEDNLCWVKPDDGEAAPFIWWFPKDGVFNQLAEFINEPAYNKEPDLVHAKG